MQFLEWLHPDSPVREYLRWISDSGDVKTFQRRYQDIVEHQMPWGRYFLSVIIRTQGKRNDMLQDVLMCLQAQRDQDFEVLIVCHRAEKKDFKQLQKLIELQSDSIRDRISVISMEEGERGAPINLGFAYAIGEYAVCLDDDDLVLDNWVECFHQAAKEHDGMILRSWALTQLWECSTPENGGKQMITAAGVTDARYCVPYHTLHEQSENMCPLMTMAFPLFLFRQLHILMNENLTTTEDWDYILRTAGIAGVYDLREITAIYRIWNTKDASRNLIQETEWRQNYMKIFRQRRNDPILLPRAEVSDYREELNGLKSSGEKGRSCFFQEAILFWAAGEEEFSDQRYEAARIQLTDGWIYTVFPMETVIRAQQIRIDPASETLFMLEDVQVGAFLRGQEVRSFSLNDIWETNGIEEGNQILFLADHPMMVFNAEEPIKFDSVRFLARVCYRGLPSLTKYAISLSADERWLSENRKVAHLYWDQQGQFTEQHCAEYEPSLTGDRLWVDFNLADQNLENARLIRFDPTEVGMIWLNHLQFHLTYEDGTVETISSWDKVLGNGFFSAEGAVFLSRDPQLILPVRQRLIRFTAEAEIHYLNVEKAELLLVEAVKVPDYETIMKQMQQARDRRWMEEGNI